MSDTVYTIAGFLESADDAIRSFTETSQKNTWESVLNKTNNAIPEITIDTSYLDSMVNIAMNLGVNAKEVAEFLNTQEATDFLTKNPTTVRIAYDYTIISIHPTGLKRLCDDVRDLFTQVSTGKKNGDDVRSWINDPRTIIKYRKMINDSTYNSYKTSKELLTPQPRKDILLSDSTMQTIITNLYKFNKVYSSSYIGKKDERILNEIPFAHGVVVIKEQIKKNYKDLSMYISSAMKSNIPSSVVEQIAYSAKVMYSELVKYLVASYLQFMSERIHDVRTMVSLKNEIESRLGEIPDMKAEMESVGVDPMNITLDDIDVILDIADKVKIDIQKNIEFEDKDSVYDKRAYDLPIELLTRLSSVLKEGTEFYREKHEAVSTGLIVRRFDLLNDELWAVLSNIFYDNKFINISESDLGILYDDLIKMRMVMPKFKNLIDLCISNVNEWVTLAKTIGDEDKEMLDVLSDILGNLKNINKVTANALLERINLIYSIAFPGMNYSSENKVYTDENNYFIDAFNANYDVIEESFNEHLLEMNRQYNQMYVESVISTRYTLEKPYFEADDNNQQNNNNQNTNNSQNTGNTNNTQNNNQGTQKNQSTTPKVTDNGDDGNNNQNQNNNNQNNNQGNQNSGSNTPISQRIGNFIQNVIDKINGFFNKDKAKEKNLSFIQMYENYLNTRRYANVSLQMLPYIQTDYIATIKGIINKATAVNESQLKSLTEDKMYEYLYSETQYARVKGNSPAERFEIAIKVGTNKNEVQTYANNTIKNMIPGMTKYVTDYYNKIANDLSSIKGNLKGLDKLNQFKSNGDNDRTDENVKLIPKAINSAIGSCINVARQRANDYIVIMNSLISKQERDKQKAANAQNNNNQNNNQQNTNDNQNNNRNTDQQQNNNQNTGNENNQ